MKVGFIGAGNMGGALARAVKASDGFRVYLFDKDTKKAEALASEIGASVATLESIGKSCDMIFLGVKPNIIPAVTKELSIYLKERENCTVVSMAAGVAIGKIQDALGFSAKIIRIMPNTPAAYGAGMILYTKSASVTKESEDSFKSALAYAGKLDYIEERLIDAGSAVSGCGPAFAYMFIEALADGGVAAGLPRDKAQLYAAQMLFGAATAALESGKHPGELKDAVCSPGGSTIEGVMTLEEGGFRGVVSDAVIAAYEKTLKLGK